MLFQYIKKPLVYFLIFCTQLAPLSVAMSQTLAVVPPNISSASAKPMMMLTASKDHTLFGPAYNDFEDIDGDGTIDTTFKPTFKYYGYFDSTKCYSYSTANSRFEPEEATTGSNYGCPTVLAKRWWSGNFLNWSSMTRLDVLRKMLYGGKRSTDTTANTILERANLSKDGHSFVKYYAGTDIRSYTPFTVTNLAKTTGVNGTNTFSGTTGYSGITICNRSDDNSSGGNPVMRLVKGNYRLWSTIGGTVCEWGTGSTDTVTNDWNSSTRFNPKLSRYYGKGQTYYGGGDYLHELYFPSIASDGATGVTGVPATAELTVRVASCVTGNLGNERCATYSGSTLAKPIGLLQEFGMPASGELTAKAEFGLITGSYDRNLESGVVRKNMGDLADEINPTTGQFCHSSGVACPTGTAPLNDGRTTGAGSIAALDRIVLYGAGNYGGGANLLGSTITDDTTPAWGNPMGEMIVQALRYFAQPSSTNPTSVPNDNGLALPVVGNGSWPAWKDPLSNANTFRKARYGNSVCRPMNVLALSSSALSFDGNLAADFATLPNRGGRSVADFTNIIGGLDSVAGVKSVGSVTGGFGENCSAKTVVGLADVSGVCPEAPGLGGTYLSAGAALYANTNNIRNFGSGTNDLPGTAPSDLPPSSLKVKTYAASLAGGAARIEVKIPGTSKYVYITPESLWDRGSIVPGGILTFNGISSSATHGAFVVTWNDQFFGGDYDMDIVGYLRYDIITGTGANAGKYFIDVTTDILGVNAGAVGSHGFSIIGTQPVASTSFIATRVDKRYLTHAHKAAGGNATLDATDDFMCKNATYRASVANICDVGSGGDNFLRDTDLRQTLRFEMKGVDNAVLNDPLWYAAKYGSFDPGVTSSTVGTTTTKISTPFTGSQTLSVASWDAKRADGQACGGTTGLSCSDGIPDGYFLARRPELLEQQLRDQLEQIVAASNAAPAVSSSQLTDGSFKYTAKFDSVLKKGSILAFQLDSSGNFPSVPSWDAGELLRQLPIASRQVITNNDAQTGISFLYSSLNATYTTAIKGTTSSVLNTRTSALIDYMRGSTANEFPDGEKFQARSVSNLLGTIVNSTPWVQSKPSAQFVDSLFPASAPSYAAFASNYFAREKLLWVGSNDGMLHGFKAETGAPVISYVPRPLAQSFLPLAAVTTGITTAGMDGSPFVGDVLRTVPTTGSSTWSTYLFSSLGRGGKGLFALDVTDPTALVQSNAANIFKWQFTSADDNDLGNVFGDPLNNEFSGQASPIVRLNNGKFAILTHNGINSTGGKAALFLLGVDGPGSDNVWNLGTDYYKLATLATDSGNGMMGMNWIDIDNNGTVDYVYGTDLKGNVWKFDLRSTDPNLWTSAFKSGAVNIPFYVARASNGAVLPITTSPAFGFPARGGVMVTFGGGKALATSGDFPNTGVTNRMFGIYDRTGTTATFTLPTGTSTLVLRNLTVLNSGSLTVSITPTLDLSLKDGWFFDFPSSSEMLLSSPDARSQNIFFTSVRAADTSIEQCFYTPPGRNYALDPNTGVPGSSLLGSYIDTSTGLTVNYIAVGSADQKVRVTNDRSSRVAINCTAEPARCACLANPASCATQCATNPALCAAPACGANTLSYRIVGQSSDYNVCLSSFTGRIQWREIPGLSTRGQ